MCLAFAQFHKIYFYYGFNGLDVPTILMFNFCRVSSIACAVSDGLKIEQLGDKAGLKTREVKYAITEGRPSFIDFMSYLCFVGGAISGPWYEFKDFQRYMRG